MKNETTTQKTTTQETKQIVIYRPISAIPEKIESRAINWVERINRNDRKITICKKQIVDGEMMTIRSRKTIDKKGILDFCEVNLEDNNPVLALAKQHIGNSIAGVIAKSNPTLLEQFQVKY